jgi:hypothetical protein
MTDREWLELLHQIDRWIAATFPQFHQTKAKEQ